MSPDRLPRLELENVLQADGAEIVAAHEKARLIHHTRDINAAGDEVEEAVRRVIRRKLPTSYYVGHCHVVDSRLTSSPQLDVVVADNGTAPILFMTENGTEYFPYEAVYAVGEVKATYYRSSNYVDTFVSNLARVKAELQREATPPTYVGSGLSFGRGFDTGIRAPYRNPLLAFMIFAAANDFRMKDMVELYSSKPAGELPNIVCFLDKGVVVNVWIPTTESGELQTSLEGGNMEVRVNPEFVWNDQGNPIIGFSFQLILR